MNDEKYYSMDYETKKRILELLKTCIDLDIGNVSFWYWTRKIGQVDFYLTEYNTCWEVVVCVEDKKGKDIYKAVDNDLKYCYSEKD